MLDQINADIKEAMKNKEKEKLTALRYVKSMIMENNTSKNPSPELDVVIKHHKKLKDSLENFPDGHPMKEQTIKEIDFIGVYLPKQMTEQEVKDLIETIKSGLESPNMGAIMKELQPQIKGRFDGKMASQMVKEAIA